MAPALVVHAGAVYQYKSHNRWKESWLCLEENGHLVWKRKDAYQVKGDAKLKDCIDKICTVTPKEKHLVGGKKPFFMSIPLKCNDKVSNKLLAVFNRDDIELWFDAFATSVGDWKLFKIVRDHHKARVAIAKEFTEDALEEALTYSEFVPYLRTIWTEYVSARHNPMAMQEISEEMPKKRPSVADLFHFGLPSPGASSHGSICRSPTVSSYAESDYVTTSEEEDSIRVE